MKFAFLKSDDTFRIRSKKKAQKNRVSGGAEQRGAGSEDFWMSQIHSKWQKPKDFKQIVAEASISMPSSDVKTSHEATASFRCVDDPVYSIRINQLSC